MNNTVKATDVNVIPMNRVRTKYQRISVQDLHYGEYQRGLRTTWVNKISKNFKEGLLGVLIVSYRDGRYYVVDGQHRLEAAKTVGIEDIICQVHTGLTYEEETELFIEYNKQRKSLTAHDLFRAGIEAKDPVALDIMDIINNHGFRLPLYSAKLDNYITATATVQSLYKQLKRDGFDRLLNLLRLTWDGERSSLERNFLNGMGLFIKLYGDDVEDDEFVKKMCKIPPESILREGRLDAKFSISSNSLTTPYAKIIWYNYNKGKTEKFKLSNRF